MTQTPVETTIKTRTVGATRWLRLDRPAAMNGINDELLADLTRELDLARDDAQVRSIVIAGDPKFFCAGADLSYVRGVLDSNGPEGLAAFLDETGRVLRGLENFPKPVIAAVDGLALGGGLEILLCCDLVVSSSRALLGDAHAKFGLVPGGGASVRLVRRLGLMRARELMYTGEARACTEFAGTLVTRVVEADALDGAAQKLSETLNARSPLGLRRMKELSAHAHDRSLDEALAEELRHSAEHAASADFAEGLAAFNEKRRPNFEGS